MTGKTAVRKTARLVSFTLAIIVVLGCSAISGYSLATKYKGTVEYTYRRALTDLSDYMSNLETTLTKGVYANTSPQQYGMSAKLLSESNGAKAALSQLPVGDSDLENVNKFVAQVGDYANYLSTKLSKGGNITEQEMNNLKSLGEYAKTVNSDLQNILVRFEDGKINIGDYTGAEIDLSKSTEGQNEPYVTTGFKEIDDGFTDYPTLIYDGPFSDHIMQSKPKLLQNSQETTENEAKVAASKFLGVNRDKMDYVGSTNGNLPTYNFSCDNIRISITKLGMKENYMLNSRSIGTATLNYTQAEDKARDFLEKHSMKNMKESYYVINGGVCTINYAYRENGVTYYSDLVKVGVALDNGEVVSYNATGYIMNHTDRKLPGNIITMEKAQKSVSKNLRIINKDKAYVPTSGLNEVLCYEFECMAENGDHVLVYINAQNGYEEQIFILLESDGGTTVL